MLLVYVQKSKSKNLKVNDNIFDFGNEFRVKDITFNFRNDCLSINFVRNDFLVNDITFDFRNEITSVFRLFLYSKIGYPVSLISEILHLRL